MSRVERHAKEESNSGSKVSHKFSSKFAGLSIPRKILFCLKYIIFVGLLSVIVMAGYTAFKVGKINQDTLYQNIERSSILYDVDGEEIDTLHYTEDRTIVSINEMPEDLKNAFIAVEDRTFYKHHGFNFRRMIGAVLSKLTGRSSSISGTSTITQQLARNAYLAEIKSRRSIRRKISEMYIAWRLEHNLSKDEILEAYLNTIYLGYGNYGVGAAARTYFSKNVGELNLAESAALAALPQAPDAYALITDDPGDGNKEIKNIHYYSLDSLKSKSSSDDGADDAEYSYDDSYQSGESPDSDNEDSEESSGLYANDISKDRRDLVLELMADQGLISSDEASKSMVDIADILEPSFEKKDNAYTYFSDYVAGVVTADLMEKYNMSEEDAQRMVYTSGLEINTTLDSDIQKIIYEEFQNDANFPAAADDSKVQASMVVTQVGSGYISAMVGGRDAEGSKLFNRAISPRQPGSSIKPLSVYGAALQKSFEYAAKKETFQYTDYGFDTQGTKYWGDYITASSGVIDEPLKINGEEWPQNFSRSYSGGNSLRTALQQSINTCAVKILWQVGLDYSIEMLEKFGLTTLATDQNESVNDINPAALGLGAMTEGVTPLEMAMAYAAFPSGGIVNTPICYTEVRDSSGKQILRAESMETKVMDSGVAWIMTDILKTVVSKGIAGNAAISGVEVGGKTGTTNDTFDVWFDGFTPEYAAALWIGTDLNVEMYGTSAIAAALWSKIMRQVPGIKNGQYDEMPGNVIKENGEYYTYGTEKNAGKYYDSSKSKKKSKDNDDEGDKKDNENAADTGNGNGNGSDLSPGAGSGQGAGSGNQGMGGGSSGNGNSGGSGSGSSGDSGSGSGGSGDSGSGGSGGDDSGSGGSGDSGSGDSGSGDDQGNGSGEGGSSEAP